MTTTADDPVVTLSMLNQALAEQTDKLMIGMNDILCRLIDYMDDRFDRIEERLDKVEERLDAVEDGLDMVEARLGSIDAKLVEHDGHFEKIEGHLSFHDKRIGVATGLLKRKTVR